MARPRKTGIDYFPLDCDFEEKIEMLIEQHGNDGLAVWVRILQSVYSRETCEFDMSNDALVRFAARRSRVSVNKFRKVVDNAILLEIFSNSEFISRKVLTSNGIRKRVEAIQSKRHKDREHHGVSSQVESSYRNENGADTQRKPSDNATGNGPFPFSLSSLDNIKVSNQDPNPNPRGTISVDSPPAATPPTYRGFKKAYGSRANVFLDDIWLDVQRGKNSELIYEAIELYSLSKSGKGNPECADDGAMIEKWAIEAARDKRVEQANKRRIERARLDRASGAPPVSEKLKCTVETVVVREATNGKRGGRPESAEDILARELGIEVEA